MSITPQTLRTELLACLKMHDWSYEYSSDYTVYCRGRDNKNRIEWLMRQLPDGKAIYDAHKPKNQ